MSVKKKFFFLFLTLAITLLIGVMGNINKTIVYADSRKIEHWTMADNVAEVIEELDYLSLNSDDIIELIKIQK